MPDSIKVSIDSGIRNGSYAMLYFKLKTRSPLFGKFVNANDNSELRGKGYFRFVPGNRAADYVESKNVLLTNLLNESAITDIKIY